MPVIDDLETFHRHTVHHNPDDVWHWPLSADYNRYQLTEKDAHYLDSLRTQACKDISTMFNAEGGCIATSMTASIIVFDVSEAIIANVPGTNVVTTELEHPSAFDGCAVPAEKYGKELRVAKTNPRTGTIDPMDVVKLVDKDTCLLSVIMTSNITGAVLDIETIAREARKIKPDLFIICDSVQHTPHGLTDMKAWGN